MKGLHFPVVIFLLFSRLGVIYKIDWTMACDICEGPYDSPLIVYNRLLMQIHM